MPNTAWHRAKKVVKEFLSSDLVDVSTLFFHQEYDYMVKYEDGDYEDIFKLIKDCKLEIQQIEQQGGEGEGDSYWTVYRFKYDNNPNQVAYVKFSGWYQSYHGSEYTEWFFVEPRQVTVTQYFPIDK